MKLKTEMGLRSSVSTLTLGVLMASLMVSSAAVAQTGSGSASAAGAGSAADTLSEAAASEGGDIVVTAQRRSERLQDVPIAVTAVTGETLQAANLTDTSNIQMVAPSVIFNTFSNPGSTSFGIRGVATNVVGNSVEQSVALVIDGIVQGVAGQGIGELADVERIEVLRGPQGTLFGKNASAGVIQVITKNPELGVVEGSARVSYASHDEVRGQVSLNVPLAETAALRVSGFYRHRDGYIYNAVRDQRQNDDNNAGIRAKLLFEPSDALQFILIGDYSRQDHDCCVPTVRRANAGITAQLAPFGVVPGETNEQATTNDLTRNYSRNTGASLEVNYDFGPVTLTSLTAYREFENVGSNDIDARPTTTFLTTTDSLASQRSQELRLASNEPGFLEYTLGLYYFQKKQDNLGSDIVTTLGLPACPGPPMVPCRPGGGLINLGLSTGTFQNDSYAAFGQVSLNVTPDLTVIAGGRYTKDDYEQESLSVPVPGYLGPPPTFVPRTESQQGTASTDNFSWRLGAQYTFSRDLMVYASATRGYKGPVTRNDTPTSISLTLPEIPMSYEIGLKSSWFDRRLTLNVAAWTAKYKDFQATAFDYSLIPPASRVTNAGALRSKGIEVELSARPITGLSLSGGLSYQDVYFEDFAGDACFTGQTVAEGCLVIPGTFPPNTAVDSSGNRLVNTPKWAWSARANYETPISADFNFYANANYYHKSSVFFQTNNSPFLRQDGYHVFGASVGFGPQDESWRLMVFARNLFDQFFVSRLIDIPTSARGEVMQYHDPEARRYIGVSLDVQF
jgi:iron complex outermembrane receptor protein